MVSRRLLFALSVLCALGLYALLFAVAPNISMIQAHVRAERIAARFNINLREPAQMVGRDSQGNRQAFRARPGSVSDLLKPDTTQVAPVSGDARGAEVPHLAARIGRDPVAPPQFDLEESLSRMDARVLEITRDAARRDLEVPRRLVRPSEERVPSADALPALRAPGPPSGGNVTTLPPSGLPSMLAEGPGILGNTQPGVLEGQLHGATPAEGALESIAPLPELSPALRERSSAIRETMASLEAVRDVASMDDLLNMELSTWRSPGEAEGYFQLKIVPKQGEAIPVLPKDVTFVVDASSSIPQHKLNVTSKGLRAALSQLRPEDRFNVVVFRDTPQQFKAEPVQASVENVSAAQEFLRQLESRGETDVYRALQPVVQQQPRPGTPGVVMVVSDGRPTTGMQDGRTIINGISVDNAGGNGIYAFGGGRTVNRYLLDLLAYRNKGAAHVVQPIDDIETALPEFFSTLRDPILVDLQADFGRIDEATVFPQALPDFFGGQAVTLYGRYRPGEDQAFALWLAGKAGDEKKEVIFRTDFAEAREGSREIARGWAFQKAYDIIGRISKEGEKPEYLNALKELRMSYGVQTSYDE